MFKLNKKRSLEEITQNKGMTVEDLQALQSKYTQFLIKQQNAGTGPFTRLQKKQEIRREYIDKLSQRFDGLIQKQTVKDWEALLILFVQYRIALYAEGIKFKSTFGDALRVVHTHLLKILEEAYRKNQECVILKALQDKKIQAPTVFDNLSKLQQSSTEAKISAAAFGYDAAIISYSKALVKQSKQVKALSVELMREPLVTKNSVSNTDEASLEYGSFFRVDNIVSATDNPRPKRSKSEVVSTINAT